MAWLFNMNASISFKIKNLIEQSPVIDILLEQCTTWRLMVQALINYFLK